MGIVAILLLGPCIHGLLVFFSALSGQIHGSWSLMSYLLELTQDKQVLAFLQKKDLRKEIKILLNS